MTFQQLKYLLEVAKCGSFNAAAQELYISQSTLSMAIKELENELGIKAFTRSNKGLTLTNEGTELLSYAQQVIEQVDLLENRYTSRYTQQNNLAISTQHYAFCVQAFVKLVENYSQDEYTFTLRETRTHEIIDDVRDFKSEIGIMYLSDYNERILQQVIKQSNLEFNALFKANVHVFVGEHHPLAKRKTLSLKDLEKYPRYSFEQGLTNSFYYSEEPYGSLFHRKNITYSDRGTLTNLLNHGSGYTLSTGVLSTEMQHGIVAIPLKEKQTMNVGYIMHKSRTPSALALRYIELLKECIKMNESTAILF